MGKPQNTKGGGGGGGDLHSAARSGDLHAVQAILSTNPLAINSRDKHSRTPLHLAAWSGQAEVVDYLCKNKAEVGAAAMDDMGALHFAAQKGHLDIVRTLVSAGASVKASTRKGMTALHYAAQGSHLDLVKYLVKKGAILAKTKAGKTPLDLAANEEVRSFLEERERLGKNVGESSKKEKAEEGDLKPSTSVPEDNSGAESPRPVDEENNDANKRKGDEEDDAREVSPEPKKVRVKLSHLQSSEDTQEEEL